MKRGRIVAQLRRSEGRKCHWCPTIMSLSVPMGHPTLATIDHVKCKAECTTRHEHQSSANQVIACNQCNKDRNRAFLAKARQDKTPTHPEWETPPSLGPAQFLHLFY